ncbi:MAG: hypothetical protein RLZ35_370 [Pseudomonadota bacterium]|jgi:hypothetical protein
MSTYSITQRLPRAIGIGLFLCCCFFKTNAVMATPLSSDVIRWTVHQTLIGQTVYVLEVDPNQTKIVAVHAENQLPGRQTLSQMAKSHGAIAGINGGFFRFNINQNGFPAGILKIEDNWYGISYQPRAAIGWSPGIPATIDRIETKTTVVLNGYRVPIHRLNPSLTPNAQRGGLFSPVFGDTMLSMPPQQAACLFTQDQVLQYFPASDEPQIIPLSAHHYTYITPQSDLIKMACIPNTPATLKVAVKSNSGSDWDTFAFIVGGAPLLIADHQIVRDYGVEKLSDDFVKQLHARSAIGLLDNGHWVFVVADQNLWNKDIGMTLPELARFMKKLGCKQALNLDGGISSGLYFQDKLINQPWFEREIGDAILVIPTHP